MRLIASGRAPEVFALDEARVLRRFEAGGDPDLEARIVEHARREGFSAPRVLDVQRDALVLERIEGPTMSARLKRRPCEHLAQGASLARLHEDGTKSRQTRHTSAASVTTGTRECPWGRLGGRLGGRLDTRRALAERLTRSARSHRRAQKPRQPAR